MNTNQLFQLAAWSAYLNAAANLVGAVSLALLFAGYLPFGKISDGSSAFLALSLIPITLTLHQLHRCVGPPSSLLITIIGILAMLAAATLSALLVLGFVGFGQTFRAVLSAYAVIGVWQFSSGVLALVGSSLPPRLAWVLMAAGTGLVLNIVGTWIGGQQHPLVLVGGLVALVGNLIWAIWLGRLLLSQSLQLKGTGWPQAMRQ